MNTSKKTAGMEDMNVKRSTQQNTMVGDRRMDPDRKAAILTGVLFIVGTVAGMISLGVFTEPILDAWRIPYRLITESAQLPEIGEHYLACQSAGTPGAALIAEGKA